MSTPSIRQDKRTGQFVPQVDGKDVSPTSFDESRAMEIAKQAATTQKEHTPLWKVYNEGSQTVIIDTADNQQPAVCRIYAHELESQQVKAKLICDCVNSHAALVAALETANELEIQLSKWLNNEQHGGSNYDGRQAVRAYREALSKLTNK